MFPIVQFECENGHAWQSPLPKYSISLKDCCPECEGDAVSMKSVDPLSLEELRTRIRESNGTDTAAVEHPDSSRDRSLLPDKD